MSSPSSRIAPSSIVLEQVDAAQQGRLAGPGRADQRRRTGARRRPGRSRRAPRCVPNDLRTPSTCRIGRRMLAAIRHRSAPTRRRPGQPAHRAHPAAAPRERVGEPGERDGQQHEQDAGHDVRREVRVVVVWICAARTASIATEDRDQAGVLLQRDQVVEQGRDHPAHGLGQDDRAHRLRVAQPERPRRGHLGRVHRLDAGPEHLGDVRGVGEDERDPAEHDGVARDALQPQPGQAEADEVGARGSAAGRGRCRRRPWRPRGAGRRPARAPSARWRARGRRRR